MSKTTEVHLFKHPSAEDVWLRPVMFVYGRGHACQLYRRSEDGEWWWDYDGRVDMKDDVQWHDLNGLEVETVPADKVGITAGEPATLWLYIENGGDGTAVPRFFLTKQEALVAATEDSEPFCENDPREFETFQGSKVWWDAVKRNIEGPDVY